MRAPNEAELLMLWEGGSARHPIDRALLLCAFARPGLPVDAVADLPLGSVNRTLLRLRAACFGDDIAAYVDCENCGERMELALTVPELLSGAAEPPAGAELEIAGLCFRLPSNRDLAAVADEADPGAAALGLLEQCRVNRAADAEVELSSVYVQADAGLEALDPAADMVLDLSCHACGHRWQSDFDIGGVLWDEIAVRARALLSEVHRLALAYGWSEAEILALSPRRRAAYLNMVAS